MRKVLLTITIIIAFSQIRLAYASVDLSDSSYFPMRNGLTFLYKKGKQTVERKFTNLYTNGWFLYTITYYSGRFAIETFEDTLYKIDKDIYRYVENGNDELYVPGEIIVGTKINYSGTKFEIVQPLDSIKVNGKWYFDIMVIEASHPDFRIKYFLAKGIGLIKAITVNQDDDILIKIIDK